jgi:Uma2 family endonuclease
MASKTLVSYEEYLLLPEEEARRFELSDGELVEVSTGNGGHNITRDKILMRIGAWQEATGNGIVVAEHEFRLKSATSCRPDVAWMTEQRKDLFDLERSVVQGQPDLAVEVVSPSDSAEALHRKIFDYLESGTVAVWAVYWHAKDVVVYRGREIVRLTGDAVLEDPELLPGLRIPLKDIFVFPV